MPEATQALKKEGTLINRHGHEYGSRRDGYATCKHCLFHENETHILRDCSPELQRFGKAIDLLRQALINSKGYIDAHEIDLVVRRDGKDVEFEADFLKDIINNC